MSDRPETPSQDAPQVPAEDVDARAAELLPEEQVAGSDDPEAQAEAILEESEERTLDPEPVERRTSAETVDPTP